MIVIIGIKVGTASWGNQQYHVCNDRPAAILQLIRLNTFVMQKERTAVLHMPELAHVTCTLCIYDPLV